MFTITTARIVGLIAVVCAVVVAPQALAAPSTHCGIAPSDAVQGYDLCGFDLSDLNTIPGYQQQQEYLTGLVQAAFAQESVTVQPDSQWQSPLGQPANNTPGGIERDLTPAASKGGTAAMVVYKPTNPGWGAAATAAKKFAAKPASERAVKTAPVVCIGLAEYDYGYTVCEWWS